MRTRRQSWLLTSFAGLCCAFVAGMLILTATGRIHKWERDNDYPFGHMCYSIFTLYENTCDLRKR